MPKKHYDWTDGPAVLGPHSLAKHTILREYIEQYILILTRGGTLPNLSLMLVDGFAGGGEYHIEGHGSTFYPGSPLILIEAVRAATSRINAERRKPINVDVRFVFIEKKRINFEYLKTTLEKSSCSVPTCA